MSSWAVKMRHLISSNRRFGRAYRSHFQKKNVSHEKTCAEFQATKNDCLKLRVRRDDNDKQRNINV